MKLLTIAIPTYNRASCLALLLRTLAVECAEIEEHIDIVIGDNASTDQTPEVVAAFQSRWPALIALRHDSNLGPDENFCRCIDRMHSKYFWIVGDDDLPKAGFIRQLVNLLTSQEPDLIYCNSAWVPEIADSDQGGAVGPLVFHELTQAQFAERVHVWMTFISGMVVRLDSLPSLLQPLSIRRWSSTNLVQLGWVYGQLAGGRKFLHVINPCVLATAGNTGGYAVLTVFADNFPRLTQETFGLSSPLTNSILSRLVVGFLPGLFWKVRFANIGRFLEEDAQRAVRHRLSAYPGYWIFLLPILILPKPAAWPFYVLARIWSRLHLPGPGS